MSSTRGFRSFCSSAFLLLLICNSALVVIGDLLHIAHAPNYVTFFERPTKSLSTSNIPKMISHSFGLSSSPMDWDGMLQGSLFKKPKANVMMTLLGYDGIEQSPVMPKAVAKYTVQNDVPFVDFNQVVDSLLKNSFDMDPLTVQLMSDTQTVDVRSDHDAFKNMLFTPSKLFDRLFETDSVMSQFDIGTVNVSHSSDATLLAELQMIMDIMKKLKDNPTYTRSKTPDFFSFSLTGLQRMAEQHGTDSPKLLSATNLLNQFVDKMTSDFRNLYDDGVIVEVLITQPIHGDVLHKTRSLMQVIEAKSNSTLNLVGSYSDNYSSIFNIILWGMIVLMVALFVISYGIWNMDPGRDSVIYRMTSQRLKKE
ncbi:renin receptor-like [Octopus vulgaris]|uniref:Renin receptor-like n=1 Tax=Octopus vulgaris TaxID=6645 RepID=A0AA36BLP1_OCTVU|nr:renin receptor-like [Octopus vulgaris]